MLGETFLTVMMMYVEGLAIKVNLVNHVLISPTLAQLHSCTSILPFKNALTIFPSVLTPDFVGSGPNV